MKKYSDNDNLLTKETEKTFLSVKNSKVVLPLIAAGLLIGGSVFVASNLKNSSKNVVENKENTVNSESIKVLNYNNELEKDRLAFYFQSCIDKEGSIVNPRFFGKLSDDTKYMIVAIKDLDKEMLNELLSREIKPSHKRIFENELSRQEEAIKLQSDVMSNER